MATAASYEAKPSVPTNAASNSRPTATLDPNLFMAARCGDSKRLKELLKLNHDDKQAVRVEPTAAAAAATAQFVVEVDPPATTAPSSGAALRSLLDGVTIEGDSLLHVVAACGDNEEFCNCARVIYDSNKDLLVARNHNDDTPLHCAAGAGNANMVGCLVSLAKNKKAAVALAEEESDVDKTSMVKDFLRSLNKNGETALHQALRAASKTSMDKLMSVDPGLACIQREGEMGKTTGSPLYLAISLGKEDIVEHLVKKSEGKLSWCGPDGRNVLHAAVPHRKELPMVLKWFKDVQEGKLQMISMPVLSELASQTDKDSNTPLHLAASLDGWPDQWMRFYPWVQNIWPWSKSAPRVLLLLDANPSSVYQPDKEGLYPIHVAALVDSVHVVKAMLEKFPNCATLRDGKGRTFLHAAIERQSSRVVNYACGTQDSSVMNMQDNNGDTPLHRAIDVGNLVIFNCLIRNKHVYLELANKEGLTPRDLSWSKIPRFDYLFNPRSIIESSLVLLGAPSGASRANLFYETRVPKKNEDKEAKNLKDATTVMGLVSVLVATMTFASAFTLPGGSRSVGDEGVAGTPVFAGSYVSNAFIVADVLAFICSCSATFCLIFTGMPGVDLTIRYKYLNFSSVLLSASGRGLMAAFALGLYMVLAPVARNIATAFCVITFASVLIRDCETWKVFFAVKTASARGSKFEIMELWAHMSIFFHNMSLNYLCLTIIFVFPGFGHILRFTKPV